MCVCYRNAFREICIGLVIDSFPFYHRIPEVKGPLFKISISKSRRESTDFSEAEKPAGNKDTLTGKTERERKRSLIKTEPSREIP